MSNVNDKARLPRFVNYINVNVPEVNALLNDDDQRKIKSVEPTVQKLTVSAKSKSKSTEVEK